MMNYKVIMIMNYVYSSTTFEHYIRRYCRQNNLTIEQLADLAGITRGTFYNLLKKESNPKLSHLIQLSYAMAIHHSILLKLKWYDISHLNINKTKVSQYSKLEKLHYTDDEIHPYDASGFIGETIPDGSIFATGSTFEKSWTIQNVGNQIWVNRYLKCVDLPCSTVLPEGLSIQDYQLIPHQYRIALPTVYPHEQITIKVTFTVPNISGRYISYWKMVNDADELCFPQGIGLSTMILVESLGTCH